MNLAKKNLEGLIKSCRQLETDIKILHGQIKNAQTIAPEQVLIEIETLKSTLQQRYRLLRALWERSRQPRTSEELSELAEAFKASTLQFCRDAQIDVSVWKSIES